MKETYQKKCEKIHEIMDKYTEQNTAVAFSGGVDSSLLLKVAVQHAKEHGSCVYAITASTELLPVKDKIVAQNVAEEMGANHIILEINELNRAGIINNPVERCYLCKKYLFEQMIHTAEENNAFLVMEGTNADDMLAYRPGIKAVEELQVKSPLKEAGITKEDVRRMALEYGISVADRPSTPCLATRFPYGTKLSPEEMGKVEKGEKYLKEFGIYNVRIRVHGNIARIEVDGEYMEVLLKNKEEIVTYLKQLGYEYITLDLEGFRSGSMDIQIDKNLDIT